MRNEERSGGSTTVLLEEGSCTVECRPAEGAPATAPLQVSWAEPGSDEPDTSVVLHVFETPDG